MWFVDYLAASLTLLPLQRISAKGIATFRCIDDQIQMRDTLLKPGIQITKITNQFEALSFSTPRLAREDCFHWVMVALHTMKNPKTAITAKYIILNETTNDPDQPFK